MRDPPGRAPKREAWPAGRCRPRDVDDDPVPSQHYSFLVSDDVFDAAFARIQDANVAFWADPFHDVAGEINHDYGGRGVYFEDPDGHNMELQTVPYGEVPEG